MYGLCLTCGACSLPTLRRQYPAHRRAPTFKATTLEESRRVAGVDGSSSDKRASSFIGVQRKVWGDTTFPCSELHCDEDGDRLAHVHVQNEDGSFDTSKDTLLPVCAKHNGLHTHCSNSKEGDCGFDTKPGTKGLEAPPHNDSKN